MTAPATEQREQPPWFEFLRVRAICLRWLRDEMLKSHAEIVEMMQMDPEQVRAILAHVDANPPERRVFEGVVNPPDGQFEGGTMLFDGEQHIDLSDMVAGFDDKHLRITVELMDAPAPKPHVERTAKRHRRRWHILFKHRDTGVSFRSEKAYVERTAKRHANAIDASCEVTNMSIAVVSPSGEIAPRERKG